MTVSTTKSLPRSRSLGLILSLIFFTALHSDFVAAFSRSSHHPTSPSPRTKGRTKGHYSRVHIGSQQTSTPLLHTTLYDDFGDCIFPPDWDSNNNINNDENISGSSASLSPSNSDIHASLRARQASLEEEEQGSIYSAFSSSYPASTSSSVSFSSSTIPVDQKEKARIRYNWKEANCVSYVRLTLDDWIRRIAIDLYPLIVCGSARGHLYLADLEAGSGGSSSGSRSSSLSGGNGSSNNSASKRTRAGQIDCLKRVHASHLEESIDTESPDQLNEAMEVLFGNYDGGGVLAIAAKRDWVVSSGREGGVHVCQIVGTEQDVYTGSRRGKSKQTRLHLQPLGRLRGLEEVQNGDDFYAGLGEPLKSTTTTSYVTPPLITSLAFDDQGTLWVAGFDGILRGYDYELTDADDQPLMLRQKHPDHEVNLGSPILSLNVNDAIGCGVATTLNHGVVLFSLQDGRVMRKWNPFKSSKRGEFARSALLIQTDEPQPVEDLSVLSQNGDADFIYPSSHWSVVVGGSKGTLFQRPLGIQWNSGYISEAQPLMDVAGENSERRIRPNHLGQIVAMVSPSPGILVTGSHDGTMRVWDCSLHKSEEEEEETEGTTPLDISIETVDSNVDDEEPTKVRTKKPRVLYALSGYKVWLGSIFANDRKLVSDGADNSIIVHSFDEDEEDVLRSREEDEEDSEDFSFD